jgi:hypothetical protein
MSDNPRIGSVSGSERDETRPGTSLFSFEPRMLTNSVSADLVVVLSIR